MDLVEEHFMKTDHTCITFNDDHAFCVRPDEVDSLVEKIRRKNNPYCRLDDFKQYGGGNVHVLTFEKPGANRQNMRRLFVSRPHAFEPAGTAACMEFAKLLLGMDEYEGRFSDWRQKIMDHVIITVVPDANPDGSNRAPVKFWDGSGESYEEFLMWMFGKTHDDPPKLIQRVDRWDDRKVHPAHIGLTYERINEHEYVEPNRDYESTFFKSFFSMNDEYHYDTWIDLHQTEFIDSPANAMVLLPAAWQDMDEKRRNAHLALGRAIHDRWRAEGGNPIDEPITPYGGDSENDARQREYLKKVWAGVTDNVMHLTIEIQNHSPKTPPPMQVSLELAAVLETLEQMINT